MFGYLVLLFTILPALELAVLIHVGAYIGVPHTFFLIILTGISGAYLAKLQGFLVIRNIQSVLEQGRMPTNEMMDGLMIFAGGVLLLTPGFITDAIGFFLLIPWTRVIIKNILRKKFQTGVSPNNFTVHKSGPSSTHHSQRDFEDADFSE